jgi:flagellar hook-associated protein FlgK
MTNMIRYQRAFDAAAKVIATADEMFLTLLGMV